MFPQLDVGRRDHLRQPKLRLLHHTTNTRQAKLRSTSTWWRLGRASLWDSSKKKGPVPRAKGDQEDDQPSKPLMYVETYIHPPHTTSAW